MKTRLFITAIAFLALSLGAKAESHIHILPSGDTLHMEISLESETATVTSAGSHLPNSLTIPGSVAYNNHTVTVDAIGNNAFRNHMELVSVQLPESITSIGSTAFFGCVNLRSINIPEGMISIGDRAFFNCYFLAPFIIPDSVSQIGVDAFGNISTIVYNGHAEGSPWGAKSVNALHIGDLYYSDSTMTCVVCADKGITAFNLPSSVTQVGDYAFNGCDNIDTVILSDNLDFGSYVFRSCNGIRHVYFNISISSGYYGDNMFYQCGNLESVAIGPNANRLPASAFTYCSRLKSVTIPDNVTVIGANTFSYCTSLDTAYIGNGIRTLPGYLFYNCTNLAYIEMSDSIETIDNNAFQFCTNLKNVELPKSLQNIRPQAFKGCVRLKEINLPATITHIYNNAFEGCTDMQRIYCQATSAPVIDTSSTFLGVDRNIPVYIPCNKTYQYSVKWRYFDNYIETPYALRAVSTNENWGTASITEMPDCDGNLGVALATAMPGYKFDHWSNGNTDNPYTCPNPRPGATEYTLYAYFSRNLDIPETHTDEATVTVRGKTIVVDCAGNTHVTVCDINGHVLYDSKANGTLHVTVPASGVYIVRTGYGNVKKVVVI